MAVGRQSIEIFLPKPVRKLLRGHDPSEVLQTEEVDAAILFCDLRGSSQFAVDQQHNLSAAWNRIEEALRLMTEAITNQYGSIGDFQGDAAMGFWGWPHPQSGIARSLANVQSACQAADMLRERFQQRTRGDGPMAGFACGIGIAAGRVVAGVLGTEDQRKIGVFGPAVNLAARLETMTKQFGVSIIIDEQAQKLLRESGSDFIERLRNLAEVVPVGLDSGVRIYELMPPDDDPLALNSKQRKLYVYARKAFEQGDWNDARTSLQQLASAGDGPSKFLLGVMNRLQSPPPDWIGRIALTAK
jgi:adenylate cyclase